VEDAEVIGRWLLERAGHRVAIRHPQRGRKARLAALAVKNAHLPSRTPRSPSWRV